MKRRHQIIFRQTIKYGHEEKGKAEEGTYQNSAEGVGKRKYHIVPQHLLQGRTGI
nr:hypothetical protein [Chryseosolibacter indicus]